MSSDQEFLDRSPPPQNSNYNNPTAWGKNPDNYYKDSQSQYSDVEDQQKEARQIDKKHLEGLADDDFMVPTKIADQHIDLDEQEADHTEEITALKTQIKKVLKHRQRINQLSGLDVVEKLFEKGRMNFIEGNTSIVDAYLMCLVMLIEMYKAKTLQIGKHIIMSQLSELRALYVKSKKQFIKLQPKINEMLAQQIQNGKLNEAEQLAYEEYEQQQNSKKRNPKKKKKEGTDEKIAIQKYLQVQEQPPQQPSRPQQMSEQMQEQGLGMDNFNEEDDEAIEQGMRKYMEEEKKQKTIRKQIKKENRQKYVDSLPKTAFETIKQHQARAINSVILRNRGLTRRRTGQAKTSRQKLRQKYDKALIKNKSKGKGVRQNPGRAYEGQTNIKMGKVVSSRLAH